MKSRLTVLMVFCGLMAAAVLGRATFIQLAGDPRLDALSKRQFQSKVLVRPRRGMILDRNGEALAINLEARSLAANPVKIESRKTLSHLLSKALDQPYSKIYDRLKEKKEFIWVKRHLTESEMGRLKQWNLLLPEGDLQPGLWLINESKRVYPHAELAAHVLGGVNLDTDGIEGVELWSNDTLRGKIASVSAVKDALGRPSFIDAVAAGGEKDGEPVQLTLDASLQYAVEHELRSAIDRTGSHSGSAVVMDAVTGEILALANEPTFDPNHSLINPANRRNRVFTDGYEPGSTLKAVLLAGALRNGMKLSDSIYAEKGSWLVQGHRISEAEAREKFEWLSLKRMIQVSSNVAAAKLAIKLGPERFLTTLRDFGFESKSGTGFPGEINGRIPPRKQWSPLTTANIGFGQGILVTPIQMIRAYATFANGGWEVQPTLIKTGLNPSRPVAPRRILSAKLADSVTEALKTVTEEGGTGLKAALEGYRIAGKTGTAQVIDRATGKYSRNHHIATFIGYPVGTQQRLVVFAQLDGPKGVYYAAETAAPLFKQVLRASVNRLNVPATVAAPTLAQSPSSPATKVDTLSDELRLSLSKTSAAVPELTRDIADSAQALGNRPVWKMPSLRGLTAREAIRVLQGHRFELEVSGNGIVRAQMPEEGHSIAEGASVHLGLGDPE